MKKVAKSVIAMLLILFSAKLFLPAPIGEASFALGNSIKPAKTLDKTCDGYISVYEDTMEKFHQNTDIRKSDNGDSIDLNLTDRCAAMLFMAGDEISEIIHVGVSGGTVPNIVAIRTSMSATILSIDPSVAVDDVVGLLNSIISSDEPYSTDYCIYTYSEDKTQGYLFLEIQPK